MKTITLFLFFILFSILAIGQEFSLELIQIDSSYTETKKFPKPDEPFIKEIYTNNGNFAGYITTYEKNDSFTVYLKNGNTFKTNICGTIISISEDLSTIVKVGNPLGSVLCGVHSELGSWGRDTVMIVFYDEKGNIKKTIENKHALTGDYIISDNGYFLIYSELMNEEIGKKFYTYYSPYGEELWTIQQKKGSRNISNDGSLVALSKDSTINFYDYEKKLVYCLKSNDKISFICFISKNLILYQCYNKTIMLFDISKNETISELNEINYLNTFQPVYYDRVNQIVFINSFIFDKNKLKRELTIFNVTNNKEVLRTTFESENNICATDILEFENLSKSIIQIKIDNKI